MSREENKAIICRINEEFINKGNAAILDELYSPELLRKRRGLEWIVSIYEGQRGFENLYEAFPDYHSQIEEQTGEGDFVVTRCTITGTHTGDFFGIAPTGKRISMNQVVYYRLHAGKVIEIWGINDELGLLHQLDLVDRISFPH
jgi:ketosteroid isomerase-like protein